MIFKSHLVSMVIFAIIVSILLALVKFDEKRDIIRYACKLFLFMCGGVILFSWVMKII